MRAPRLRLRLEGIGIWYRSSTELLLQNQVGGQKPDTTIFLFTPSCHTRTISKVYCSGPEHTFLTSPLRGFNRLDLD